MKLNADLLRGAVISIGFGGALFLSYIFSDQPRNDEKLSKQTESLKIQSPTKLPVEANISGPKEHAVFFRH